VPLTPEQRAALRTQIRDQNAIVRERRQELEDARQRVREVSRARRETLREVELEERRERLQRLVETQEAEREKEIEASQRRANDAIEAYKEAVDKGKIPLAKARAALITALEEAGVPRKETKAWLAGKRLGSDFNSGFAESVADFGKNFKRLLLDTINKQQLRAPVIIVTDAPTIRRVLSGSDGGRGSGHHSEGLGLGHAAAGMAVPGQEGSAVPILAHAGEWILNRSQQLRMALIAGTDRSILQRALFHHRSLKPNFSFAAGGVVPAVAFSGGGTQFLTPINIQTASPTVDIEYVSRALERRIASAVD